MSDDNKQFSYHPKKIERAGDIHIDPTTGHQTFPSWFKRSQIRTIQLDDLGLQPIRPTRDDEQLAQRLINALGTGPLETKKLVKTIQEIEELKFKQARRRLTYLWQCGLVRRKGMIHGQSGRPMNQEWYLNE